MQITDSIVRLVSYIGRYANLANLANVHNTGPCWNRYYEASQGCELGENAANRINAANIVGRWLKNGAN